MLLENHLKLITSAFTEHQILFTLVGGLALSTWVEPRSTKDIDLIVDNVEDETISRVT